MAGEAEAALLWYGLSVELDRHARATVSNLLYTLLMVRTIAPQVVARELDMCAAVPGLAVRISRVAKQLHSLSGEFIAGMHRRFEETCRIETAPAPPLSPGTRKRIRIAISLPICTPIPVVIFLEGVIPAHDRNRFEIVVFSPYTERDKLTAAPETLSRTLGCAACTDRLEIGPRSAPGSSNCGRHGGPYRGITLTSLPGDWPRCRSPGEAIREYRPGGDGSYPCRSGGITPEESPVLYGTTRSTSPRLCHASDPLRMRRW